MFKIPGQIIVAYTDGSSHNPNGPWHGGWGMHIATDLGGEYQAWQGMVEGTTNNRAEMKGLDALLQIAVENKWQHVTAYLDSQIVIKGITKNIHNWKKNNWIKQDGNPVKNQDLWIELEATYSAFKKAGIVLVIEWVKGHNGVRGNEIADQMAKRGLAASLAGDYTPYIEDLNATVAPTDVGATEPKKKSKKAPPYNPLICGSSVLDTTNYGTHVPEVVFTANWNTPDKDDIPHRFVGVASADRFEGAVVLKEPEPILELVRQAQAEVCPTDIHIPVVYNWSKIVSAKNWKVFHEQGRGALLPTDRGDLNFWDNDTEISYQFFVPRMAWFSIDSMNTRLSFIDQYRNKSDNLIVEDVTAMFADISEKGKYTITDRMKLARRMDHIVKHPKTGKDLIIPMVQGKSIPDKNTFGRIIKQDKEFSCHIILHSVTATTMRWSLIVETPSGIGCYDGPDTNLLLSP
ncbi:ribonuclease H [Vibrio phage BONAISHI]|nr:ribonuclease H [Vibrio phage BONAISHI]